MAFSTEPTRTPAEIGDIKITLLDKIARGSTPAFQDAVFDFQVIMSDGTVRPRSGNLTSHITTEQRAALMAFVAGLRTQAEEEILP